MTPARRPIVTDADRQWAVSQMPVWARRGARDETVRGEIGNYPPRQLFYVRGKKAHNGLPM